MKTNFPRLLTLIALSLVLSLGWRFITSSSAAQTNQRRLEQVPVTTLPGQAKRWALVIGVDQYRDSQDSTTCNCSIATATTSRRPEILTVKNPLQRRICPPFSSRLQ